MTELAWKSSRMNPWRTVSSYVVSFERTRTLLRFAVRVAWPSRTISEQPTEPPEIRRSPGTLSDLRGSYARIFEHGLQRGIEASALARSGQRRRCELLRLPLPYTPHCKYRAIGSRYPNP